MKTVLFTPSYLNGVDGFGNDRFQRNFKYLNYYAHPEVKEALGIDLIVFADNNSSVDRCNKLLELFGDELAIMRFDQHLERRGPYDYPYIWRAFYSIQELIKEGFEKIILLDSDCYVLTNTLAQYIKGLSSGWTSFWCPKYNFAEASAWVLCKDTFSLYYSFIGQCKWEDRPGTEPMETLLPFTHIAREFTCDRWGEENKPQQDWMDLYCQAKNDFVPVFK